MKEIIEIDLTSFLLRKKVKEELIKLGYFEEEVELDPKLQIENSFNYEELKYKFETNPEGVYHKTIRSRFFPALEGRKFFLSHYHDDDSLAISVANLLVNEEQGKSFVDGELWGNVYDIIKELEKTFDQQSVYSSFFPLLVEALKDQMDKSDYLIFLNTRERGFTYSPWIFSELSHAHTLRRRLSSKNFSKSEEKPKLKIKYPIEVDRILIEGEDFLEYIYESDQRSFKEFFKKRHKRINPLTRKRRR